MGSRKRHFRTAHSKTGAFAASVLVHLLIFGAAVSVVAFSFYERDVIQFHEKQLPKQRLRLKKLQVPVNTRIVRNRPKIRKTIECTSLIERKMPDYTIPDFAGTGDQLRGLNRTSGIGDIHLSFDIPEIEVFGVKSRGEKVFIILDSTNDIMLDEKGGMLSYSIIKDELIRILRGLPSTTLFNIAVYDYHRSYVLSSRMLPAADEHIDAAMEWLAPLNRFDSDTQYTDYGVITLGEGGTRIMESEQMVSSIHEGSCWLAPLFLAARQRADSVYLLTGSWGRYMYQLEAAGTIEETSGASASERERWARIVEKARRRYEEDQANRKARGLPPRVLPPGGEWIYVKTYYPEDMKYYPRPDHRHIGRSFKHYQPEDVAYELQNLYQALVDDDRHRYELLRPGISKKAELSINVIHLIANNALPDISTTRLGRLAERANGAYKALKGLSAIQAYVD